MLNLTLTLLNDSFTIHRLNPKTNVPATALDSSFFAITRTSDELSIVVPDTVEIQSEQSETGWAGFKVEGPLDFNLVGVLAGIATVLTDAKVSIFALPTFDTDYILIKRVQVDAAKDALTSAGYRVREEKA